MSASGVRTAPGLTASNVSRLIRFRSQTGTWLLMLPTLWALVLSSRGIPPWRLLVIFMLGSFLMRSAGVILNDLADQSFDRHVTRTRDRPLTVMLSPVAFALAALYPFAKRVVHLPQAVLGVAFGWGTIMAWSASRDTIEAAAWLTFGATICWAIAYDTIYALQDMEDDRRIGVKSSALYFGSGTWLAVGMACAALLVLLAIGAGMMGIGWIAYVALAVAGTLFARQVNELRKPISSARASELFHQHVWIGTLVLCGLVLGFLW
jgi:4-hydroxybenzoate polyprenyltransferase